MPERGMAWETRRRPKIGRLVGRPYPTRLRVKGCRCDFAGMIAGVPRIGADFAASHQSAGLGERSRGLDRMVGSPQLGPYQ